MCNPRKTILSLWITLNILILVGCDTAEDQLSPLDIAHMVSDKVIRDAEFSFDLVPQQPVLGMQIIDFGRNMGVMPGKAAFAISYLYSDTDTSIQLAISSSVPAGITVNDQPEIDLDGRKPALPVEISYNRFDFQRIESVPVQRGENKLVVRSQVNETGAVVFLRAVTPEGDWDDAFKFSLKPAGIDSAHTPWLMIGPLDDSPAVRNAIREGFTPVLHSGNKEYTWFLPKQNMLMELAIDRTTTYQRESYLEWHYANGALLWSMLKIPARKYTEFVREVCNFTGSNMYYFRWQYEQLYALRGSYHRIFRRTMLDDAGAPTLPYAELMLKSKDQGFDPLVTPMGAYLRYGQQRLDDGTFCRPEPVPETVWADDLFMSVPFLLQLAELEKDRGYLDDAALQVENFYALLYDPDKKLIYHGWYNRSGENTPVHWGRANGWMIWAVAEALVKIPEEHPAYQKILYNYRNHVAGLISCQDNSGMWHQVLDHPESYEETSCTAMFILAIARGISNGWLDKEYMDPVVNAWEALKGKIDSDGTVHGICRGTGIGKNLEFYFNRQTFDHDPRGLGAVITAAVEVSLLFEEQGK